MEEDYKKLYLEQRIQRIQIELQALGLRHAQMQAELPSVQKELEEYNKQKGKKGKNSSRIPGVADE